MPKILRTTFLSEPFLALRSDWLPYVMGRGLVVMMGPFGLSTLARILLKERLFRIRAGPGPGAAIEVVTSFEERGRRIESKSGSTGRAGRGGGIRPALPVGEW